MGRNIGYNTQEIPVQDKQTQAFLFAQLLILFQGYNKNTGKYNAESLKKYHQVNIVENKKQMTAGKENLRKVRKQQGLNRKIRDLPKSEQLYD